MEYLNSISRRTTACQRAFQLCLSNPALAMLDWIENRQADFNLWTSSIKATSSGKSSLDYRVRERPDVREFICQLLEGLLEALEQLRQTDVVESASLDVEVNGPPQNADFFEDYDTRSFETSSLGSSAEEIFSEEKEHIQTILHQLAKLSTAIRKSGSKYRFAKADATLREENYADFKEHLTALIIISRIRAAQRCSQDSMEILRSSASSYESLTPVQRRLIRANINRRNRLKYATRNMHLKGVSSVQEEEPPTPREVAVEQRQVSLPEELPRDSSPEPSIATTKLRAPSSTNKTKSAGPTVTATKIGSDFAIEEVTAPKTNSVITRATLTAAVLEYPRCPKPTKDDLLQCPWCGDLLSSEYYTHEPKWRSHVAHDLLPYMCIFEQCESPNEMFTTSEELANHTLQEHGTVFWVCDYCKTDTEGDRPAFESSLEWEQHMASAHTDLLPRTQLPLFADFSRKTLVQPLSCPICDLVCEETPTAGFGSHILQHLHEFALNSLPWELSDDKNTPSQNPGPVSGTYTSSSQLSSRNLAKTDAEESNTSHTGKLSTFLLTEITPLLSKVINRFSPSLISGREILFPVERTKMRSIARDILAAVEREADGADELPQNRYDRLEVFANKVQHILNQLLTESKEKSEISEEYFNFTRDNLVVEFDLLNHGPTVSETSEDADDVKQLQSAPTIKKSLDEELSFLRDNISFSPDCEPLRISLDLNCSERRLLYKGKLSEADVSHAKVITFNTFLLDNYLLIFPKGNRDGTLEVFDGFMVGMESEEQHGDWVVTPVPLISITPDDSNVDVVVRRYLDDKTRHFRVETAENYVSWSSLPPPEVSQASLLAAVLGTHKEMLRETSPFCLRTCVSNAPLSLPQSEVETNGVRTWQGQSWLRYSHIISHSTLIEAQCAFGITMNVVLVGTSRGVWSIRSSAASSAVKRILETEAKRIALIEERDGVLILSNTTLNYYGLQDLVQLGKKAGCGRLATGVNWFTVVYSNGRTLIYCLSEGSTSTTSIISVFDAYTQLFAFTDEPPSLFTRFWTPTNQLPEPQRNYLVWGGCSSLTAVQDNTFMVTPSGFKLLSADKASTISVPTQRHLLPQSMKTMLESQLAVAILPLGKSEVILVYERFAVYMGLDGVVSRPETITFVDGTYPVKRASLSGSFLVLFTERYVEVRNAKDGKLRQIIPGNSIKCLDGGLSDGTTTTGFNSVKGTIKFVMTAFDNPQDLAIVELVADRKTV